MTAWSTEHSEMLLFLLFFLFARLFVLKLSLSSLFIPHFQGSLEEIQGVLNTTEISLHQLTALVDCRSLHMVSGGVGEGVGGGECLPNTHILPAQLLHICPKTLRRLIHSDVSVVHEAKPLFCGADATCHCG